MEASQKEVCISINKMKFGTYENKPILMNEPEKKVMSIQERKMIIDKMREENRMHYKGVKGIISTKHETMKIESGEAKLMPT